MAKITNKEIALAIHQVLDGKSGSELHSKIESVVVFLNKKRLMSKSKDIFFELKKIINKKEGVVEARLAYAKHLSRDAKNHIEHSLKRRYKAHNVILKDELDESLIGGFKVEAEDEVIDLSIKNGIGKLKEHLTA